MVRLQLDEHQQALLDFTRHLIALRHQHPVMRRQKFFHGRPIRGADVKDITWFRPDGHEMTEEEWNADWGRALAVRLGGDALDEVDEQGNRIVDDTLLLLLNAHHDPMAFLLPPTRPRMCWSVVLDTNEPDLPDDERLLPGGEIHAIGARSLVLLRQCQSAG